MSGNKKVGNVDFDYGPSTKNFMEGVKQTLVKQPDFGGVGGHGPQTHGPHGPHSQTTIRMADKNINFREKL